MNVQFQLHDTPPPSADKRLRIYETVVCPACTRFHYIDKSTGKLLREKARAAPVGGLTMSRLWKPRKRQCRPNYGRLACTESPSLQETMPFGNPANRQLRSAIFQTSDVEMFRDKVLTRVGAASAEIFETDAFEAHGQLIELRDIVLLAASSTSSLAVEYPEFDFVRLSIPLAGRGDTVIGGETIEVNNHESCVTPAGQTTKVRCDENHSWINLRVKPEALTRRLTSILGSRPNRSLEFKPVFSFDHPRSESLKALVVFLGSTAQFWRWRIGFARRAGIGAGHRDGFPVSQSSYVQRSFRSRCATSHAVAGSPGRRIH